jgi:hypothetical protein
MSGCSVRCTKSVKAADANDTETKGGKEKGNAGRTIISPYIGSWEG